MFDYTFGGGHVVVHTLPVEFYNGGPHGIGSVFHRNLLDFGRKLSVDVDNYLLTVQSGEQLNIRTTTPENSIGEATNTLDPRLELYNENGVLVSSDDNSDTDGRNALITYTVPNNSLGTYTVRVSGKNRGAYSLSVTGATPTANPAPFVTSTTSTHQT